MRFTWDPSKAASNKRKHGIGFEEAATTFADPLALWAEDYSQGERRFVLIGQSDRMRMLFTVHVELEDDTIRIISARRTTTHERRRYEEGE